MLIDLTVVVVYLVIVALFGRWVGGNSGKDKESYFLGGKSFDWVLIGFSLFAASVFMGSFVGGAGLAGKAGGQIDSELLGGLMLPVSALIFISLFIRSNNYTNPQFLGLRFDTVGDAYRVARDFRTVSISGGRGDIRLVSLLIVVTVGSYSIFGGLKAVVVTDFVQIIIMLVGCFAVFGAGLYNIGGFSGLALLHFYEQYSFGVILFSIIFVGGEFAGSFTTLGKIHLFGDSA